MEPIWETHIVETDMHLGGRFFLIRHYSIRKLTQQTNMSDIILKDGAILQ